MCEQRLVMAEHQTKIQHLLLRAGFGATPSDIDLLSQQSLTDVLDELFTTSAQFKDINYLPYPLNEKEQKKGAGAFKQVKIFFKSFGEKEQLNEQWIFKLTHTKAVLREKMVFFWHNHFATSVEYGYLMQQQNNTLRKHALGKFSDMLHAIAKDPAMILYLNNQQNKKDHPNENFAREVMELFTLGEGNYTEHDIKEAARAFTGWTIDNTGTYTFREKDFDNGEKEFMGQKGSFTGENIIDMLLANKQTAVYLVSKIYRDFVNFNVNAEKVALLSEEFFNSGYDISKLMYSIFSSDWFYEEKNVGTKIASPVELIVRLKKYFDVEFLELKYLINYQKALGQVLLFPPNVAGWKGGPHWIDSASLLLRLNTISHIHKDGLSLDVAGKPAFEEELDDNRKQNKNKKISAKWTALLEFFEGKTDDEMIQYLIQGDSSNIDKSLLQNLDTRNKILVLLTYPEFQLI